jgi:hypothetical protein
MKTACCPMLRNSCAKAKKFLRIRGFISRERKPRRPGGIRCPRSVPAIPASQLRCSCLSGAVRHLIASLRLCPKYCHFCGDVAASAAMTHPSDFSGKEPLSRVDSMVVRLVCHLPKVHAGAALKSGDNKRGCTADGPTPKKRASLSGDRIGD